MRAGLLRRSITIENNTPTQDATGQEVDSWGTFATGWGEVKPMPTGAEEFMTEQPFSEQYYQVRMRYTPTTAGINTRMRLLEGGRVFDIERVHDESDRRREIRLYLRLVNP